MKSEVIM